MPRNASGSLSNVVQIVILGAIWGGAFTLIKILVHELGPLEIAAGRLAFGAIAVVAFLRIRGGLRWPSHLTRPYSRAVAGMATCGFSVTRTWNGNDAREPDGTMSRCLPLSKSSTGPMSSR